MKLIDKDALVAEIERRIKEYNTPIDGLGSNNIRLNECKDILSFINTLEVKEVGLEKEATRFVQTKEFAECEESPVLCLAKHFFELGLNAKG